MGDSQEYGNYQLPPVTGLFTNKVLAFFYQNYLPWVRKGDCITFPSCFVLLKYSEYFTCIPRFAPLYYMST